MLKHSLLALSTAALLISGCSSYPDDAKGVAIGACEAMKELDFEGMKKYAVKESHAKLDQAKAIIENSKAFLANLPEEARKKAEAQMDEQMAKMKAIDCSGMQIANGENGMKLASLPSAPRHMKKIQLKEVEGQWKIID